MNNDLINNLNKTKRDIVLEAIREAILSGEYRPGEKILQEKLAEEMNISQTPIREALRILEVEGLIEYYPHKGVRVSEVSVDEIKEIYTIRIELELLATRESIKNISDKKLKYLWKLQNEIEKISQSNGLKNIYKPDYKLHMLIYESCEMPLLLRIIKQLWGRLPRDILQNIPGRAAESAKDYKLILEAIEAKDVDETEKRMKYHIESGLDAILNYLSKNT